MSAASDVALLAGDAPEDAEAVISALRRLGLLPDGCDPVLTPLTGGVASDIWKVDAGARSFVVKRALAKLRVAADWRAPVSRNASEVGWLKIAAGVSPACVPQVLAHDPEAGLFAMSYLPPERYANWKVRLAAGDADPQFARSVGKTLAAIHSATAGAAAVASAFANDAVFHAIRLEPYFESMTAARPSLAAALNSLSRDTLATKRALVHGDVSPKNILVGPAGPVFLDAECAWYGDPAFDLAFCLNHLLLKCVWRPQHMPAFLASFDAIAGVYLSSVTWEPPAELERRVARLLPALLLARVDGKSPVEYIRSDRAKNAVRAVAIPLIRKPPLRLHAVRDQWIRGADNAGIVADGDAA